MNLEYIYKTAYNGDVPDFSSKRRISDLLFATIICGLVEEIQENEKSISLLDIFTILYCRCGLTLDDLVVALKNTIDKKYSLNIDRFLFENFCENDLFNGLYDLNKKNPAILEKIVGCNNFDNLNDYNYPYSYFFLCIMGKENIIELANVIDSKHKSKQEIAFISFINQLAKLNNPLHDYDNLVEKYVQSAKLDVTSIRNQIEKILKDCNDSRVNYALNYFNRNPKVKRSNQMQTSGAVNTAIKNEDWSKIVELPRYVIGQDEATQKVVDKILGSFIGFRTEKEPVATFLMTGPTGVGKTETAKAVADLCFGGKIFTVDMTTFKTKEDISRLLGASPNYVGYGDSVAFCEFIEENPQCVLLFDEIEKADRSCLDILMRMLDEGEFINARGKTISLKDAVIFCTTNLTEYVENEDQSYLEKLTDRQNGLRKEIVGRFQEVIEYKHLTKSACKQIAKRFVQSQIDVFNNNNASNALFLEYTDDLLEKIVKEANSDLFGARDIKKSIQANLIAPVAKYVLTYKPKQQKIVVSSQGVNADNQNTNTDDLGRHS